MRWKVRNSNIQIEIISTLSVTFNHRENENETDYNDEALDLLQEKMTAQQDSTSSA